MAENENEKDEDVDNSKDIDGAEDQTTEDGDSEEKKKGLSKPLLIKIAAGVVLTLLIAGGAYFFLMSDEAAPEDEISTESTDELTVEAGVESEGDMASDVETPPTEPSEGTIDTDNLIELPEGADGETTAPAEEGDTPESSLGTADEEQAFTKIRDVIEALQEENSRLKKQMGIEDEDPDAALNKDSSGDEQSDEAESKEGDDNKGEASDKPAVRNIYSDIYDEEKPYPYVRKAQQEPVPKPKWGD